ncbi:hypothetical protein CASFOL_031087 [Castilleja foliolosa]|uniref:rRNA N-glycosylase n=1 Tax=Castilleja foliolosa TaxID=1961234 RepID=A0ABD3C4C6_9LAMI
MPPRNNRGRGRGGGAAEGRRQPGGDGGGRAAEGRRQPGGDGGGRAAEGRGGRGGGNAQAAAVPELTNFPTREIDPNANYDRMNPLPFSSRYVSMEKHASSTITGIELGMAKLRMVVDHLSQLTIPNSRSRNPNIAAGLLISVLMFAESSRFESIFNRIKNSSDNYFSLLNCHEFYIKNWSKLSKVLIAANERPEMIETINHAIEHGLHGLGDMSEAGFTIRRRWTLRHEC